MKKKTPLPGKPRRAPRTIAAQARARAAPAKAKAGAKARAKAKAGAKARAGALAEVREQALSPVEEQGPLEPSEVLEPEVVGADLLDAQAPAALPLEPEVEPEVEPVFEPGRATDAATDEAAKAPVRKRLTVHAGRDLSRADALQRYLGEISRHPLLTREEETDLATRFVATRDPQLAYRLVTGNLRLVVKIAFEFRRAAFNVLDLIQEGNVGLMQAVQKFDPTRGVKLSSYSAWWIRAYILRYLMDNWRMVKLGTTQAQRKLFFNLRKEQEKLISQGLAAEPRLLAERLDVSEQEIREMDQRLGNDEFSLDTPIATGGEDSRQTYLDRLSESRKSADDELGDEELRRNFREHLAAFGRTLTDEKDKFLFAHRIAALDGEEPMTLQDIGNRYGFTRERARQLEARLTDKLRVWLKERMPDFGELSFRESED